MNGANYPYYVVLGIDEKLTQMWNEANLPKTWNVRQIVLSEDDRGTLGKCDFLVELQSPNTVFWDRIENRSQGFVPDGYIEDMDMLCLQLANTHIKLEDICDEIFIVELYVPVYGNTYDVRISRKDRIGELLPSIEKQISLQETGSAISLKDAILCEREAGIVLDVEMTPEEAGILNGTRLMLI